MKKYLNQVNILLYLGFFVRLFLIPMTTSPYMLDFFIPFIDKSVLNPFVNPWSLSDIKQFPYGLVCFIVFYIPKSVGYFIFGSSAIGSTILSLSLMKLPLIVFDFAVLKILQSFLPQKKKTIYFLYWLNPVIIYLTFIYSHIDIISVCFFLGSLFYVLKGRINLSAVFFGLAFASKFYVFVVLPFLLVYIWNTYFARQALSYIFRFTLITALFLIAGFLPLFLVHNFSYVTWSSPEALKIFSMNTAMSESRVLYIGIVIILITIFRLILSTKITQNGLILGCYFVFGTLLLISFPLVNWYLWFLPGFVFFYVRYTSFHRLIFFIFSLCVLLQVVTIHYPIDQMLVNIIFTLTQTTLLLALITMWIISLRYEIPLHGRINPFLIGVAGDSGAGKNHLSSVLENLFGKKATQTVEGDNYHRWQRGDDNWKLFTHLQPTANHLNRMLSHTQELKLNKAISSTHYDHDLGSFTFSKITEPKRLMIFQGLHTFYLNDMRKQLDIKIFLNPDENLRLYWKIQRDVFERKHTVQRVLETTQQRAEDSKKYILPQAQFADWIIEMFLLKSYTREMSVQGVIPTYCVRHILPNEDYKLNNIVEILNRHADESAKILDHVEDFTKLIFEVYIPPSDRALSEIIDFLDLPLRQITKSWTAPKWEKGYDGLIQLLALIVLQKKRFNE